MKIRDRVPTPFPVKLVNIFLLFLFKNKIESESDIVVTQTKL